MAVGWDQEWRKRLQQLLLPRLRALGAAGESLFRLFLSFLPGLKFPSRNARTYSLETAKKKPQR